LLSSPSATDAKKSGLALQAVVKVSIVCADEVVGMAVASTVSSAGANLDAIFMMATLVCSQQSTSRPQPPQKKRAALGPPAASAAEEPQD
jgi:hypothetical protein